jgi:hypothetical protein
LKELEAGADAIASTHSEAENEYGND